MQDFLAVSLINGYVTVAISLGGRTSSFDLRNDHRLDDGAWHHVEIKRNKKVWSLLKPERDSPNIKRPLTNRMPWEVFLKYF